VVRHFAAAAHKLEAYHDELDHAFYTQVVTPINELLINESQTAHNPPLSPVICSHLVLSGVAPVRCTVRTALALKKQYESLHLGTARCADSLMPRDGALTDSALANGGVVWRGVTRLDRVRRACVSVRRVSRGPQSA
jgi:hypothetical protein